MKSLAIFLLVAVFSDATMAADAKTASAPQGDDDRVANTLAGPPPANNHTGTHATSAQPSKKALKKAKVAPKPKLQDPN
ncbi:MAG TPA: hypothetical protein VGC16_01685 [Rhizomicrobium sp.]